MRISLGVLVALPSLAACGNGGFYSAPTIPQVAAPLGSIAALSEAQSDVRQVPQPLYTPGTNDLLYVSNQGNNSITVYHHNDGFDAPPIRVIAGSKTQLNLLSGPAGALSEDSEGNLYVANGGHVVPNSPCGDFTGGSILVFAHGANGNVAPIREIIGPKTGLHYVAAIDVDPTTGKVFAADLPEGCALGSTSLL